MSEITNLNKVRKARAKADKGRKSAVNKAKHGRTKDAKKLDDKIGRDQDQHLDGHKLDDPKGGSGKLD